jgi:hypothetical protein
MAARAPRLADDLPDIDDHIVEPWTPYEMYDGKVVRVLPSKPPHAERHAQVSALVETTPDPGSRSRSADVARAMRDGSPETCLGRRIAPCRSSIAPR